MNQTVSFWKQWISLQLKHNLARITQLSIKNFHAPGLNYMCFDFAPHQTIRLYIIEPKDHLDSTHINIHNHLYDSQLLVLKGNLVNNVWKLDNDPNATPQYNIYSLTSALHPDNKEKQIKLKLITKRGLKLHKQIHLGPGDSHFQKYTEIHNVANDPSKLTAFMVFEFPTVTERSRIFTTTDYGDTLPTPNAYLKYSKGELKSLVGNLLDNLE